MDPIKKIGTLLRSIALQFMGGKPKTSPRMSKGAPGFTRWNVARVLAIGALMSAGVAMYFNVVSEGAASNASQRDQLENSSLTREQQRSAEVVQNSPIYPDDEWIYGPPYLDDFSVEKEARSSSIGIAVGIEALPVDDPYAHLTPEESDATVPFETVANYDQQRSADSIEERLEVQEVLKIILEP